MSRRGTRRQRDGNGDRGAASSSSPSTSPSHGPAGGWASQIRCCGAWCGGRTSVAVMLGDGAPVLLGRRRRRRPPSSLLLMLFFFFFFHVQNACMPCSLAC
ncbi:Os11g0485500 [Oryza sativa Japonica Group]|uniref:Os11g0485500 protein n=2 Tax=Oryza sativa subsp. japonica TaxID=39947 RepID=B9GAQ7_ORYSJ|nr:expressed protein [Oryza sativa Japonica Group]EEE52113.1 hypothetical protein OsJ_33914 [Oryza sativa Japonica Group]BAG93184.1 unnamed protein product [Oryza sativa Japonica Group]BAH95270.1 Os11g0485500 [Oryza sativa Japonica Group]BAT14067.1 Os11g0485500 [Oryza sativa Japonica Group]|eukprot:NP_001176542.1 Os11g0485500 [Oryza sativa Japonica Group]